jgi:hypothetical protein
VVAASLAGACALADDPTPPPKPTNTSNLLYRIGWADLGVLVPAPTKSKGALKIEQGGEGLLQLCMEHPEIWRTDHLWYRFEHMHPLTTISCRERKSPGVHVVFYDQPDGSREAWLHFDLHGPQNFWGHGGEIMRNSVTFGKTSQYDVYRGLVKTNPNGGDPMPPPRFDFSERTRRYAATLLAPSVTGLEMFIGTASAAARQLSEGGGSGHYVGHITGNLVRSAISQSVEYTSSMILQQDDKYKPSREGGLGRRMGTALARSFVIPGREGNELAFPRIAAAMATPWITRPWHPGFEEPTNPWVQTAYIYGRYVVRSFLAEFQPELSKIARKIVWRGGPPIVPAGVPTQQR